MKPTNIDNEITLEAAEDGELAAVNGGSMFAAGILVGGAIAIASTHITQHYLNRRSLGKAVADAAAEQIEESS